MNNPFKVRRFMIAFPDSGSGSNSDTTDTTETTSGKDYSAAREQDTIDNAVKSASKVPGSLTLNELNAISDKGLVVGGGSGEDYFPEFKVIVEFDENESKARYLKGEYSDLNFHDYAILKITNGSVAEEVDTPLIHGGTVPYSYALNIDGSLYLLLLPDGTITVEEATGSMT